MEKELLSPIWQTGILGTLVLIAFAVIIYLYKQREKDSAANRKEREEWRKATLAEFKVLFDKTAELGKEYKAATNEALQDFKEVTREQIRDFKDIIKENNTLNGKVMNTLDRINSRIP